MKRRYVRFAFAGGVLASLVVHATIAFAGNVTLGATDSARMKDSTFSFVNRILYKFALPDTLATVRVDRAILRVPLTADTVIEGHGLIVFPSAAAWTGGNGMLSYTNLEVIDAVSAVDLTVFSPYKILEMDVTGLLRAWASGLIPNQGLVIESILDGAEPMEIPSKLAFPTASQVELEIWFAPSPVR